MKRTPLRPEGTAHAKARRLELVALREAKKAWKARSVESVCAMCGASHWTTGHHVLPLRILKANKVPMSHWFDLRNYFPVCTDPSPGRCHERHELYVARIPRERLEMQHWEFAARWDLEWVLDREYPEPRSEQDAA